MASLNKRLNRWQSYACISSRQLYLGVHNTEVSAVDHETRFAVEAGYMPYDEAKAWAKANRPPTNSHNQGRLAPSEIVKRDTYAEVILLGVDRKERARAKVDLADVPLVGNLRWCVEKGGYASTRLSGERKKTLMHRLIIGLDRSDRRQTDHINRDRLDNRRSNLRAVTQAQNLQNLGMYGRGTNKYRGVFRHNKNDCWFVSVKVSGVTTYGGSFSDELQAAAAANKLRRKLHTHSDEPILVYALGKLWRLNPAKVALLLA